MLIYKLYLKPESETSTINNILKTLHKIWPLKLTLKPKLKYKFNYE
jgi:hypothetical protein